MIHTAADDAWRATGPDGSVASADSAALITDARSPDDVRIGGVSDRDSSVTERCLPDLEAATPSQPHAGGKGYIERATT
jgi:hypothetical protein